MNEDQKFMAFIDEWAKKQGCTFEIENFDGRESEELIDGMAAEDVWGWLIPEGGHRKTDEQYGCVVWEDVGGKLELNWRTDF